ncbi:hypothetical protein RRF57_008097 [Xylaria bambusicola]|uniref:Uncharacterized protein n=1 Tax=Xylaria bambusicola TaxID=326684 RepID=A0AAN7UM85_9PEZI
MIARGAPVGAVCLRCRLRLLHQLSPAPVHNVASYATAAADADAGTDVNRANDQVDSKDAAEDDRQVYKDKPTGARRSRRGWKHFGAHKQYVSNNRVMSEVVRSLNSDMLGKPGHVIVMRDGGKLRRGLSALKNLEPEKPPESTSIEELLHSQREAQTTLEIRSNIHRLRPQTDTVLPKRRFEKLRDLLTSGFLSPQLQDYMLWHKSKAEDDSLSMALDTPSQPEFPWMKNRTAWVPLESEPSMADRTDFNLQGYVSETISPKQKLAIRLMRECWHLSIAELETELGETWIKLNDDEFTILMRGTQRFMNTLGKIWLDPGEQIEAFRREKMLRLVTTKYKVDSVIRDLDETLQCVTTKTFPIVLLGSGMPDDKILEHVGKITNSHIKKSHTLRRLHVTWLNIKSRAAHGLAAVEDIAHIVFRLLLTASGSPQVTSTLLPHTPSESHGGRLIVDVTSKEKLGWKDRLGQWARYAHPLSSEETVTDTALPIKKFELPFQPSIKEEDLDENVEFFPDTEFPKSPVKWSGDGKTSTTAHFGYILHPYQSSNPTPHLSNLLASTERRVFSPLAPHPLHFTKFESNDSGTAPVIGTRSTVVLRFWPSPSSQPISRPPDSPERSMPAPKHAKDTPPAPILELRLAASPGTRSSESRAYEPSPVSITPT